MKPYALAAGIGAISVLALGTAPALALTDDTRKEIRSDIAPGGTVNLVNNSGSVIIHGGGGRQVVAIYTKHSAKVEVDQTTTPDKGRVDLRIHVLSEDRVTNDEASVAFEITVPAGVSVSVSTSTAPITADGLTGDVTLSSDTGQITVRNVAKAHVHARSVTAPVSLTDIVNGHVEITSNGGAVQMVNVSGSKVSVGTTNGNITYRGDCSGGGSYDFTTHSGAIDVKGSVAVCSSSERRSINMSSHSTN